MNILETKDLVKGTYESKVAQNALMRSVYTWMTLALAITGLTAMYMAKSRTIRQNKQNQLHYGYPFVHCLLNS